MSDQYAGDILQLEAKAKENAKRHIATLLQRPDQLERVDQIRRRVSRKKTSVEAQLKTAVQNQLDGVRTGLNQLQSSLQDIRDIKDSLLEIDSTCKSIDHLHDKLADLRKENAEHSQLAAAVENLKHIFNVPETVKRCQDLIERGKLLHAHKNLCELERARDELLFELHRSKKQSSTDKDIIMKYFTDVDSVEAMFAKQLWLVLTRTLITVRREPANIVTVLRIIEREERTDAMMLKRREQTDFMPPTRPKRWRDKASKVMEEAVTARIEGSQMEDRSIDKMWLVRHLEVIRQLTLEDLRVVTCLCEPCFPPYYDIVNAYVEMYHNAIAQHVNDIVQQGLEPNEIVSLLTWVFDYNGEELMGHPDLKLDTSEYGPLLADDVLKDITNTYLNTLRANFKEWMSNSLQTDVKDWNQAQPPDSDHKGYYHTQLPLIQFQMIEQNLQVADSIGTQLVRDVVSVVLDELKQFNVTYKVQLKAFKDHHLADRSQPLHYIDYMVSADRADRRDVTVSLAQIANVNNCHTFKEQCLRIKTKHCKDAPESVGRAFEAAARLFEELAFEVIDYLIEEVFMDLHTHINDILTKKWMQGCEQITTILMTIEDYNNDFIHMKEKYFEELMRRIRNKVIREYLKALFARKVKFSNYDERVAAADRICHEADQMDSLFGNLVPKLKDDSPFTALNHLSEVLRLKDTSMLSLELSGVYKKHEDVRVDQLVNLLLLRGDLGRADARVVRVCKVM